MLATRTLGSCATLRSWGWAALLGLLSVAACGNAQEEPTQRPARPASRQVGVDFAASGVEEARARLQYVLPSWNEAALEGAAGNTSQKGRSAFHRGTAQAHGRTLSGKDDFAFAETRLSGMQLFRSKSGPAVLTTDLARGRLMFIANVRVNPEVSQKKRLSPPSFVSLAERDFDRLGLPAAERDEGRVDTIESIGENYDGVRSEPMAVARIVEFRRRVNGIPVHRSYVRSFYGLDGKLLRANVNWPEFRLAKRQPLKAREQVIDEAAEYVAAHRAPTQELRDLSADVVYLFDQETLTYEPGVVMKASWRPVDREGGLAEYKLDVRYSLHRGIVNRRDIEDPR